MEIIAKTDVGNLRKVNEDSLTVIKNRANKVLLLIADGMGGHNAGEVASTIAKEIFEDEFLKTTEETNYTEFIKTTVLKVNNEIYSQSLINSEYSKMGTTLSLAIDTGKMIYIGHVGDSRIYYANNNKLRQLTKDHTMVQSLYDSGQISKKEMDTHPHRNILLQSLGIDKKVTVDILEVKIPQSGTLLLCSDGLSEEVSDIKIKNILLNKNNNIEQKADTLIAEALQNKGKDNVSIILMGRG